MAWTELVQELARLHAEAEALVETLRRHAEARGTKLAWEAHNALKDSLHDLWGAYGALALDAEVSPETVDRLASYELRRQKKGG